MSSSSEKPPRKILRIKRETGAGAQAAEPSAKPQRRPPVRARHLNVREQRALGKGPAAQAPEPPQPETPRRRPKPQQGRPQAQPPGAARGGRKGAQRPEPARAGPQAPQRFFAPCPRGLETELAGELDALGATRIEPASGGVGFSGELALAWKVNLWSRLAIRVLQQVAHGHYRSEDDLYRAALALPWPEWFDPQRTIAVRTVAHACPLKSLNFASLRIKDAVCDRFREELGVRPSVNTRAPDVPIVLYLERDAYTLYLDLSGEPLNRRGYRIQAAEAPLNENLAAGLLRLAGWTPDTPLLDPMMGGGTILLEAGLMALNVAPGLKRHFAFEHLASFDRVGWARLRKDAQAAALDPRPLPIYGCDIDPRMVRAAEANLRAAGLLDCVRLRQADVLQVDAPASAGVIVSNPPYGVRLPQAAPSTFYASLGDALKRRFAGWTAFLLSADAELPRAIGLRLARRTPLYNGPLECRLYEYRLVAGGMRRSSSPRP